MKYLVSTPFFLVNSRGVHNSVKAGTILSKKQYGALTPQKRLKCSPIIGKRADWVRSEVEQLVELYLQNDNLHWVRDTFIQNNPDQLHSVDSVYQTVAQLRTLDTHYVEDVLWKVTALTEEIALELDSDRFGSKEDSLARALEAQAEEILKEILG